MLLQKIIFTSSILLFSFALYSQSLKIDLVAGMNASQIDGDEYGGYGKVGLLGGMGVKVPIKEDKSYICLQALYSQKGARTPINRVTNVYFLQRLNYLYFPLYAEIFLTDYISLQGGIAGAYLISNRLDLGTGFFSRDEVFNKFTTHFMAGGGYMLTSNLGVYARVHYSMQSVRNDFLWFNNVISFQLELGL